MISAVLCVLHWVWHLFNLPYASALFWLISIARYVFNSPSICLLRDKIWRLLWTCCLLPFYIVTPSRARLLIQLFASTVGKFLSQASYLPPYVDPVAKPFFQLQKRFPRAKFSVIRLLKCHVPAKSSATFIAALKSLLFFFLPYWS